jgi:hypothetical protein
MNRKIGAAVILLVFLPGILEAQSPAERIEAAKVRAEAAGVPVSLLDSKVEEGLAKGVPMTRIALAVEHRATALTRARAAMRSVDGQVNDADLTAGADALGSGISEAILQSIAERAPQERRAVAITALTELVTLQVVPEVALQRVLEALARGPDELAMLPGLAGEARGRPGMERERTASTGIAASSGAPARPPAAPPTPARFDPPAQGAPGGGPPGQGRP